MTKTPNQAKALCLAVLLAMAMALGLPARALAAGACTMAGATYASLADAVAAAPAGTPTTITLAEDQQLDETVAIPADKNITLTDDGTSRSVTSATRLFAVEGSLTIAGTSDDSLHLYGAGPASDSGTVATVGGAGSPTAHLTLAAGTIHGGTVDKPSCGAVLVNGNGTFDMTGGIITGTANTVYYNAPVYLKGAAVMNFSGGSIEGNESDGCGGILLLELSDKQPTLNMTGGTIRDNNVFFAAAIYAGYKGVVNLSGGTISDNVHNGQRGGGIVHIEKYAQLNMSGGTICDNTSNHGTVTLLGEAVGNFTGGTIRDNKAAVAGGGIFAIDDTTKVVLTDAAVYDNHASVMGGGLWYCPTGGGEVNATEGLGLFSNKADGAGDDFASIFVDGKKVAQVALSDHALGDGQVLYYRDGAVLPGVAPAKDWEGTADASVPRFDASNPGDPMVVSGEQTEGVALKSVVSDATKSDALGKAKFVVTGNTASYGGGIACNGILTAGESDGELQDTHTLVVSKRDGAGATVAGAELQLTDGMGNVIAEWTSEANKNHVLDLPVGNYVLHEAKAPEGYELAEDIAFHIDRDGNVIVAGETVDELVMVDERTPEEPDTPEPKTPTPDDDKPKTDVGKKVGPRAVTPRTGDANGVLPVAACAVGVALLGLRIRMARKVREDA